MKIVDTAANIGLLHPLTDTILPSGASSTMTPVLLAERSERVPGSDPGDPPGLGGRVAIGRQGGGGLKRLNSIFCRRSGRTVFARKLRK
jgi:hypothetical protein